MKILWLVNIIMPELAEHLGQKPSVFGGWLTGAMEAVVRQGNQLVICTTVPNTDKPERYELKQAVYYLCTQGTLDDMEQQFRSLLEKERPDIVHVFGTEFPHSLAMARAADTDRMLITIQGSMAVLEKLVYAGIPDRICKDRLLHRLLRRCHKGGQSIDLQKISFRKRAVLEKETLSLAKYIHGGSEWGNRQGRAINPSATVFDCGLILRDPFYTDRGWSIDECEPYSICAVFTYPIKGFHQLLKAMPRILEQYPKAKLYAVGHRLNVRRYHGLKRQIMELAPDYQWYIQGLMDRNHLWDHVIFEGTLDASAMAERMRRSHVFVVPSIMENQCTALGEALMLGVPAVTTRVGAIPEYITEGESALAYDFDDTQALAEQICSIFESRALAQKLSLHAPVLPRQLYHRDKNSERLLEIYTQIAKKKQ